MGFTPMLRRIGVASLGLFTATALLATPTASADTGDGTPAETNNTIAMTTDKCSLSEGRVVPRGNPNTPLVYEVYFGGPGAGCVTRARFVGVRDGRVVDTGYAVANGNNGYFVAKNVNRCFVEFGVQRKNGTFYTRAISPSSPPESCPE